MYPQIADELGINKKQEVVERTVEKAGELEKITGENKIINPLTDGKKEAKQAYNNYFDEVIRAGGYLDGRYVVVSEPGETESKPQVLLIEENNGEYRKPGPINRLLNRIEKSNLFRKTETKPKYYRTKSCARKGSSAHKPEAKFCGGCGSKLSKREVPTIFDYAGSAIKHVAEDIGSGILRGAKAATASALYVGCKASYPVLGNFSGKVQLGIEGIVGKKNYDAINAIRFSRYSNIIGYSSAFAYMFHKANTKPDMSTGAHIMAGLLSGGLIYGGLESVVRWVAGSNDDEGNILPKEKRKPIGSLVGKLASLPIEFGMYLTKKGREFYRNVKEKVEKDFE